MNHEPIWNNPFSTRYIKKIAKFIFLHTSRMFFIPPGLRKFLLEMAGIKFLDRKSTFIGTDVLFDIIDGTTTTIGRNVVITTGSKLITHYPIITKSGVSEYKKGDIVIKDSAFIGMNALIIKSVTIGQSAVVGAGAVVTKDVPDYAIVGGNPAVVIGEVRE